MFGLIGNGLVNVTSDSQFPQVGMILSTVKNTSRSKEKNDNAPTDKTEQVTSGMKQILAFFKEFSFTILVIAWNKHEWTSEGILFQLWKDVNTHHFSSSSPPTLSSSPVWFVFLTKMADSALWLVRSPVNQTPCEGSIAPSWHTSHMIWCSIWVCYRNCVWWVRGWNVTELLEVTIIIVVFALAIITCKSLGTWPCGSHNSSKLLPHWSTFYQALQSISRGRFLRKLHYTPNTPSNNVYPRQKQLQSLI